jgi:hypothetical protein
LREAQTARHGASKIGDQKRWYGIGARRELVWNILLTGYNTYKIWGVLLEVTVKECEFRIQIYNVGYWHYDYEKCKKNDLYK